MSAGGWEVAAVAAGAAAGGVARFALSRWMQALPSPIPLGTLAVNGVGGLLMGLALVAFARQPEGLWRLLLVTGFLGGFTTFSAFSAESLGLLQRGQWAWALLHTAVHVLGALAGAAAGFRLGRAFWG